MRFSVLAGKCVGFGGKMRFSVLTEKCVFSVLVEKCDFTGLTEKCVFMEMCVLHFFFCGKTHLAVLAGMCVFQFLRENVFFGYSGKMYMQENRIYGLKIIF